MKKKISLLVMAAMLISAAMIFTGCGKLKKGQVYQGTKDGETVYCCFHSDGYFYTGKKENGTLVAQEMGRYSIDNKAKKITLKGKVGNFELKGSTLTIMNIDANNESLKLKKVSSPTEDEIKKAVK